MATKKKSKAARKSSKKPRPTNRTKSRKSEKPARKKAVKQAKRVKAVDAAKTQERTAKVSGKRLSGLDAAALVLKQSGKPMKVKPIVETMLAKGHWKTGGKTPWATIYSSIIREITTKGKKARFKKTERGTFVFNG